jgi:hypothetical protein
MKKSFLFISFVLLVSLILGCTSLGNPSPDNNSLAVSSVTPLNNAKNVAVKATVSVTFNKAMNGSSAEAAYTMVDPSANAVSGSFAWSGNTMTFTPDDDLDYNTVYTCTVGAGAQDSQGEALSSSYTWSFTSLYSDDETAPTIKTIFPLDGAADVATLSTIAVEFSEAMGTTSTEGAFVISPSVAGTFNWIGNIMIFTPGTALTVDTTYTCTVGIGAQDRTGNTLEDEKKWEFTTRSTTDSAAPTIIFTIPSNHATIVPVTSAISVIFSEAMNTSSVQNAFAMVDPSANAVNGSVGWNGNTMTFTPTANLDKGKVYTCTVGTGATDSAGIHMADPYSWNFTTILAPPTVGTVFPAENATDVPVSSTIIVEFSEAMNTSTITGSISPEVSGTRSWDTTNKILTVTLDTDLTSGTTYTVTIVSGENTEGTSLTTYSWSFTTASD